MNKKKKKIIIISSITFVLVVSMICILLLLPRGGNQLKITIDGKLYGVYNLNKNQTIRIEQKDMYNIVEIKDGKAFVKEANCKNQICVNTPPISKEDTGLVVCLPHGLILEISE